jgi:aspartyl/asparaginyl beta-hydroxylase (cupin superfamily)
MKLQDLNKFTNVIREELNNLPDNFISKIPRKEGEWDGSEHMLEIVDLYTKGNYGWLKGGQDHVQDSWVSWPIIWNWNQVPGNCNQCPKTAKILSKIKGIKIAGLSLMKGGVKLKEHTDGVGDDYLYTYHLGLKCPEKCFLHHSVIGTHVEENGKALLLDAREPHWAENQSEHDRVILYMEIYSHDI